MRDDRERILDMLEAIENIERHAGKGREAFERDELIQTWIVHHIEIIGEAASKLGAGFRAAHSEVPWSEIVAILKQKLNEIVEELTPRGKHD